MQCPKCQMDNPEINMFCRECGAKLSRACTQCGAEVLSADKFCGKCGQQLSIPAKSAPKEPSFDEKLAKIQKYLPSGLTEKILSRRDRIEGERKQVTVLFTDMAGYLGIPLLSGWIEGDQVKPLGGTNVVDGRREVTEVTIA